MTWKGVKKSISRLPYQFKTRNGGDEITKDLDYLQLEGRYKCVVKRTEEFRMEILTYRDNLTSLLDYQSSTASCLTNFYDFKMGSEEPFGETYYNRFDKKINPEMKQAVQDYATAMSYCKEESVMLLNDLDITIIDRLDQFQAIIKTIDKTITKREHKLIDYDRFRISYIKFTGISDPSPSEEKHLVKLQTQYEDAVRDYEYFNDMLKEELTVFLNLAQKLLQPIIYHFYSIQSRAMGGIYGRLNELIQHNTVCFPTLDKPVLKGFQIRSTQKNIIAELDRLEIFNKDFNAWERNVPSINRELESRRLSYQRDNTSESLDSITTQRPLVSRNLSKHSIHSTISTNSDRYVSSSSSVYDKGTNSVDKTPPPLAARPAFLNNRARSLSSSNVAPPVRRASLTPSFQHSNSLATLINNQLPNQNRYIKTAISADISSSFIDQQKEIAKKKRAPPPPPPSRKYSSPSQIKKEYVRALYELNAPQNGDLSFHVGDLIEVLEKSEKTEDWWKGRLGNQIGMFPANYVKLV